MKLDIRLIRVLRFIDKDKPIGISRLANKIYEDQRIDHDLAYSYIQELTDYGYITSDNNVVARGSRPFPSELEENGFYHFYSECWACGRSIERLLDVGVRFIFWQCTDCDVKWTTDLLQ